MKQENNVSTKDNLKQSISDQQIPKPETSSVPIQNKQSLVDMLTQGAENFAQESTKKKRESEYEKVKFMLNGKEISLKEIRELVASKVMPYFPIFPNDIPFYKEIYRLMGWHDLDPNKFTKPRSVANLTLAIIYKRFPADVLASIHVLNGYLPNCWVREYKNFQFLNEEGQRQVKVFRDEAIEVMKTCETMHEFRIKMNTLYKVPYSYQLKNLFE